MSEDKEKIELVLPLFVFTFVIVAWGASWYLLKDVQERGTFGDMFGAINALFSGLAFAGVIYAILLQRKELKLQRTELELTRRELEGQKEQMKAQNITLKKQNFENTFFQLLRLHNEITNGIDLMGPNNQITKGRDCFKIFYERFRKTWNKSNPDHKGNNEEDRINKTYLAFYQNHQSEIGHYFRSLYNIVKFVDNSNEEYKKLYTNLVRAQLSSFELALLFYNVLSEVGRDKFKPYIEKYSLLKTLPKKELLNPSDHLLYYKKIAYGE